MIDPFGKETRLYYAIKGVQSVFDTLNPNDHVSMKCTLCTRNRPVTVIVDIAVALPLRTVQKIRID